MFGLTRKKGRVKPAWAGAVPDHPIALVWSADGNHLAAAASTGPVAVFDAAGKRVAELPGHPVGTLAVAWNPVAPVLATSGKDGRVRVWDAGGRETGNLEAGGRWVEHLAWHPSGQMLAAACGKTVHLWDAGGQHLEDLTDHPSTVSDLAWKPGTRTLAALVYGGVLLWTIRTPDAPSFRMFPWKGSPLKMAWSPDAVMLAHGNQDATVHFWYTETVEELQMSGYATKVRELSWDHTSRYLATGGGPAVCVWDCGGEGPQGSQPQMLAGHAEDAVVTAVAFQHRGGLLACAGDDGRVNVWQPANSKQPLLGGAVTPDTESVCGLAWSPDDRRLAYTTASGTVAVLAID